MSRWFRHYAGMMRDEKLVSVAVRSKQPVERVVWVWGAILESAAEIDDGGRYEFDAAEAAYFLRADEADLVAIVDALTNANRLGEGVVVKWRDRQYQSDRSVARQAAYRERKRAGKGDVDGEGSVGDGGVTSRDGGVTPQETDTDTELPNPLRDWAVIERELRKAAGWESEPSPNLAVVGPIVSLLKAKCDWELDVLPTVRAKARGCRGVKTWKYFIGAIQQARDDRLGALSAPNPTINTGKYHARTTSRPNTIADSFAAVDAAIADRERAIERLERGEGDGRENLKLVS